MIYTTVPSRFFTFNLPPSLPQMLDAEWGQCEFLQILDSSFLLPMCNGCLPQTASTRTQQQFVIDADCPAHSISTHNLMLKQGVGRKWKLGVYLGLCNQVPIWQKGKRLLFILSTMGCSNILYNVSTEVLSQSPLSRLGSVSTRFEPVTLRTWETWYLFPTDMEPISFNYLPKKLTCYLTAALT